MQLVVWTIRWLEPGFEPIDPWTSTWCCCHHTLTKNIYFEIFENWNIYKCKILVVSNLYIIAFIQSIWAVMSIFCHHKTVTLESGTTTTTRTTERPYFKCKTPKKRNPKQGNFWPIFKNLPSIVFYWSCLFI